MKFYDSVTIEVSSGTWGDGLASWRREKYVAFGGPSGGDGGRWWSVWLEANPNEYTLMPFRYKKKYAAKSGNPGQTSDKYGKDADDIVLHVPLGTLIKDVRTGRIVGHVTRAGERICVARGGKGWAGNIHFKNASNQFPNFALLGEPGETKELQLELLLLGDVALMWAPSVGKTSLINTVSAVRAKTADYHFTTLVPNIGVVTHKDIHFTMVDIPGLIAWAHAGKWLGNAFLRHMLKARIRVLMSDVSRDIDGIEDIGMLLDEMTQYISERFQHEAWYDPQDLTHHLLIEDSLLIYQLRHHDEVVLQKGMLFVSNKIDVREQDNELLVYYQTHFLEHVTAHCNTLFGGSFSPAQFAPHYHLMSAFLPDTVDALLNHIVTYIHSPHFASLQQFADITAEEQLPPSCHDATEKELQFLLEEWYIEPGQEKFLRVWEVYHPSICYLSFVTPRWNHEWELRYWYTMAKEWHLQRLEKHGARKWDVLKIRPTYAWMQPRYILWS